MFYISAKRLVIYLCVLISAIMCDRVNSAGPEVEIVAPVGRKNVEMEDCSGNFDGSGEDETGNDIGPEINKTAAAGQDIGDKKRGCKVKERNGEIITTNNSKLEVAIATSTPATTILSVRGVKLQFPPCPPGESIASEKLQEHHLPFGVFSTLMGFLQPAQFPLDLLKEVKERHVPFHVLLLQAVKLEGPAAGWIVLWAVLSLCIPCSAIAQICCPAKNLQRLRNHSSNSTINAPQGYTMRTAGLAMNVLLIVFITNLTLMIASNEQLTKTITRSPERAELVFDDFERFTKNVKMQLTFVTAMAIDRATDVIERDLEDVGSLIGIPFQEEVNSVFKLGAMFQTLRTIQKESLEISRRVKGVIATSKRGRELGKSLEERVEELVPALDNIHQQCSVKDRPLCETLLSTGLTVTFRTDEIYRDMKLKYLAGISEDKIFNSTLLETENNYKDIPKRFALDIQKQISEIRRSLQQRRMAIHKALRAFEDLSRSTIGTIRAAKGKLIPFLQEIASRDSLRYLTILAISVFTFLLWITWMCGAPCGCENSSRAVPYLIIGLTFACLISLLLWLLGSIALLLGIHSKNIVCDAFDEPEYATLTHLLDDKGILYPKGGYFKSLLKINESIKTSDVFRNAERNQSSYKTFKLKNVVHIEGLLNTNNWHDLNATLTKLHTHPQKIKLFSKNLEPYLTDLNSASNINLTAYRKLSNAAITGKDLSGFLDQVYAIAKQITDARTSNRLEKLIFKLRDVINTDYARLSEVKEKLFYELTALDVVLKPFREKSEGLLKELGVVQMVFGAKINEISKEKSLNYIYSLKNYLDLTKNHVEREITYEVARMKPLWNIYFSARTYVCDEFVGAVNALSFSCYLSILLIITLTPITKRIIKRYREIDADRIHYRSNEDIARNGWETPQSSGTPIRRNNRNDESVWASPRQSITDIVPPPPRPPSSSRRSSSPRAVVPTVSKNVTSYGSKYESPIPTISKAFSSRHEASRYDSLKLIERSTWRTPGSPAATPRRWI